MGRAAPRPGRGLWCGGDCSDSVDSDGKSRVSAAAARPSRRASGWPCALSVAPRPRGPFGARAWPAEARSKSVLTVVFTCPSRCLTHLVAPPCRAFGSPGLVVGVLGAAVQAEARRRPRRGPRLMRGTPWVMSPAKNPDFCLQFRLQSTVFAAVRTRSSLFKPAGQVGYGPVVNPYERDQLGLAV